MSKIEKRYRYTISILAALTLIGRLYISPRLQGIPTFDLTYEAFAHIFVGALLGMAIITWPGREVHPGERGTVYRNYAKGEDKFWKRMSLSGLSSFCFTVAVLLTLFEVAAFAYQKYGIPEPPTKSQIVGQKVCEHSELEEHYNGKSFVVTCLQCGEDVTHKPTAVKGR